MERWQRSIYQKGAMLMVENIRWENDEYELVTFMRGKSIEDAKPRTLVYRKDSKGNKMFTTDRSKIPVEIKNQILIQEKILDQQFDRN